MKKNLFLFLFFIVNLGHLNGHSFINPSIQIADNEELFNENNLRCPKGHRRTLSFKGPMGPPGIQGPTGATGSMGATGSTGATGVLSTSYAVAFIATNQLAITPGTVINLSSLDPVQSGGYSIQSGGVRVPDTGVFLVAVRVAAQSVGAIGLAINGVTAQTSKFAISVPSVIAGTTLLKLTAGDLITIVNSGVVSFNTLKSSTSVDNIVVSLTFTKVAP